MQARKTRQPDLERKLQKCSGRMTISAPGNWPRSGGRDVVDVVDAVHGFEVHDHTSPHLLTQLTGE